MAQLAALRSPCLSTRTASDGTGIDQPLRHFEPPPLGLGGPDFHIATVPTSKCFILIPELGAIRIVIRMFGHIGADRVGRNDCHEIVPKVLLAKTRVPDSCGARPRLVFFSRLVTVGL